MKLIKKYELRTIGTNAPICPNCGNWNAMLQGSFQGQKYYKCRDCKYIITNQKAEHTYYELDKPGMGNASTYTQVEAPKKD